MLIVPIMFDVHTLEYKSPMGIFKIVKEADEKWRILTPSGSTVIKTGETNYGYCKIQKTQHLQNSRKYLFTIAEVEKVFTDLFG